MTGKCFICSGKRVSGSRFCKDCITKLAVFRDGVKEITKTNDHDILISIIDKFYWTAYDLCKIKGIRVS